ncbi:MAG: tRNA preQ1(34) S-adenosylmethionine ribosyltransferase-isomerase QueA, partial [Victivallaceae bacterium]|nr:tRNA preQ1(34) S-adenosylmethionine ribosyltransferase-isomerase QueA [Victivallaceae bacterium]
LDRKSGETTILPFPAITDFLSAGDVLIRNNTRVLSGRMYGRKRLPDGSAGAHFELLLVSPDPADAGVWQVLLKPGKRAVPGTEVVLSAPDGIPNRDGDFFVVLGKNDDGTYRIRFSVADADLLQRRYGTIPLPPYLRREALPSDAERYQTVYAHCPGAVAAPTAGLHFTPEIFDRLKGKGIGVAELTLHVGPGTFVPVSTEDATKHPMHTENFDLPEETACLINRTHENGNRVLAVGTTTVRVLESCASGSGKVVPRRGATRIFLYPPYRPRAVDMLLTNFHLPKSTLLMLVSCFCDREKVLAAYEKAKAEKMRFYSYGDCMLLK